MSLKFGSLFKDMLQGATNGATPGSKSSSVDTRSLETLVSTLKGLKTSAESFTKSLEETESQLSDLEDEGKKGTKQYNDLKKQAQNYRNILRDNAKEEKTAKEELAKETEDLIDIEKKATIGGKKYAKSVQDINSDYIKGVKEILESTKLSAKTREEELAELKKSVMAQKMTALWTDTEGSVKAGAENVVGVITDAVGDLKGLKPVLAILEYSIMESFKQVIELNDWLIKLQRSTSGMVTAARLGYDVFGNSTKGMQSLNTAVIAANISREEFSQAMNSLASNGFGQTIGAAQDLTKSQQDLSKYGIEASRVMKLYGADLGPSVRNLFQNFGKGIGEATSMLKDAADKARQLGLSTAAFIKNFEAVTDLVGEVYFATTEQMQKMATIATQLGVSVGTMAKGLIHMNGIVDLFSQQQRNAALGLDTTARALSKIYALRAQGKSGEAAKVAFSALAKDMQKQGMVKGGQVTQQGIATLDAAGVSKDAIAGIQKLAMQAEKTGIDVGQLGDISKLSKMQQLKLAHEEAANITLEEQFNQITGLVKQTLIDPLAAIFGPIMKGLLNVAKPLAEIFNTIVSSVMELAMVIVGPVIEAFNQVVGFITDIIQPISNLFTSLRNAMTPTWNMLKQFGIYITKFVFSPFRMISTVIGGVIDVFAKVITAVSSKLTPVFDWLSDIFQGGGGVISDMLDGITAAFGWLGDVLGDIIGGTFSVLGAILKGVVSVFKGLWSGVKKVWDVFNKYIIQPISTVLGPVFDWLGDLLSPIVDTFKELWKTVQSFIDWIESFLGGKGKEDSAQFATNWDSVLGKDNIQNVPTSPSASTIVGQSNFVKAPSKTIESANADHNYIAPNNQGVKNNIVINTSVSGVVSNIQTIKKAN